MEENAKLLVKKKEEPIISLIKVKEKNLKREKNNLYNEISNEIHITYVME